MTANVDRFNYILLSSCLIWLTCFPSINGFATEKCNNAELAVQIPLRARCMEFVYSDHVVKIFNDFVFQVAHNDRTYDLTKGCKLIRSMAFRLQPCSSLLYKTCFNDEIAKLDEYLGNSIYSFCDVNFSESWDQYKQTIYEILNTIIVNIQQNYSFF